MLTSPTVATVGLSITIPFAIVCDFIVYEMKPSGLAIGGALLVTLGFIAVNTNIMRLIHRCRDRVLGKKEAAVLDVGDDSNNEDVIM